MSIDLSKRKLGKSDRGVEFYKVPPRAKSPFNDRYDLLAEKQFLIQSGIDPFSNEINEEHDEFVRYLLFLDRVKELQMMTLSKKEHNDAEKNVGKKTAMANPGVIKSKNVVSFSTRQAFRGWIGQVNKNIVFSKNATEDQIKEKLKAKTYQVISKSDNKIIVRRGGFPGVMRCAGALTKLWSLTSTNNPFVDYMLIKVDNKIIQTEKYYQNLILEYKEIFKEKEQIGLHINIFKSTQPVDVELEYASSYGSRLTELLMLADYTILVIKTAKHAGILTKAQEENLIYKVMNKIRSITTYVVERYVNVFSDPEVLAFERTADMIKPSTKVMKIMKRYGLNDLPANIYTGELKPWDFKPVYKNNKTNSSHNSHESIEDDLLSIFEEDGDMVNFINNTIEDGI